MMYEQISETMSASGTALHVPTLLIIVSNNLTSNLQFYSDLDEYKEK